MPTSLGGDHPDRPGGSEAPRRLVHEGPVFKVRRVDYLDAGRRSVRKDFIEHPGAVTVIPEEEDGSILLVRVGRIAVDRFLLEFCAGKLEPGEDPKAAAGRELEEEVGRRAERIRPIASFLTSPGCSDEHLHAFHASGLRTIPTRLEPGEEIEVVRMRPEEIEDAMLDGRIEDGKTIAAWHLFQLQKRASKEGS